MTRNGWVGLWRASPRKAVMSALAIALVVGGCAYPYSPPRLPPMTQTAPPPAPAERRAPVTILISIDGFRPDYLDRGVTPVLSRLAREGATGPMVPAFPTKTFPNHWTLVTGLVPDRHGIVGNRMEDPARPGETFTMASDDPFWWSAAEPIWVTAESAGVRTAIVSWPGSNVAWGGARAREWPYDTSGGARPADWQQYAEAQTGEQRVRAAIDWLRRPAAERPRFLTLYFDTVDTAGHRYGPDDPRTTAAVRDIDGVIGGLTEALRGLGQPANLVIVADHGMAATSTERTIALDRLADPADYRVIEDGPYAGIAAQPGREAALAAALLRRHPHMTCWRKSDIPARLRYGASPRVPAFLCLAEIGWLIARTTPAKPASGGSHGYDQREPTMRALFIAHGPDFRAGRKLDPFPNTDVAPLLRELLGLQPGTGLDGSAARFQNVLRRQE